MELLWSAMITSREFSLLDHSLTKEGSSKQEKAGVMGVIDINEHEIKIEVGEEVIRIYHEDGQIIVSRDNDITKEILLGEIKKWQQ
jgi:hypothetical protein